MTLSFLFTFYVHTDPGSLLSFAEECSFGNCLRIHTTKKISFGLCLLQLTARGWETSRLKASQLQLSQKHSQLSIDTDIYYLRLIRDFMRHLT